MLCGWLLQATDQIPNHEKILDRREAIQKAIGLAQPQDVVIITGKGSETTLAVSGGQKIPWSDRQIIIDLLTSKP